MVQRGEPGVVLISIWGIVSMSLEVADYMRCFYWVPGAVVGHGVGREQELWSVGLERLY